MSPPYGFESAYNKWVCFLNYLQANIFGVPNFDTHTHTNIKCVLELLDVVANAEHGLLGEVRLVPTTRGTIVEGERSV